MSLSMMFSWPEEREETRGQKKKGGVLRVRESESESEGENARARERERELRGEEAVQGVSAAHGAGRWARLPPLEYCA